MGEKSQPGILMQLPPFREDWQQIKQVLESLAQSSAADATFDNLLQLSNILSQHRLPKAKGISETFFGGLKKFHDQFATEERSALILKTIPCIAQLVLDVEKHPSSEGLLMSRQQHPCHIKLSRKFVASIVASGFLCLFKSCDNENLPCINFQMFFAGINGKSQRAKLRMILHYFERIASMDDSLKGVITYSRIVLAEDNFLTLSKLQKSDAPLIPFIVDGKNKIEDSGSKVLQVDFANEYLGGGVLHSGNVQEEIRFSICPELLSSMWFMECMAPNEAIVIQGFEQFSCYEGYGGGLQYGGDYQDPSERDDQGNILTSIVAIDAVPYAFMAETTNQYQQDHYMRDINKAYAGFLQPYLAKNVKEVPVTDSTARQDAARSGEDSTDVDKLDPKKEDSWVYDLDPMSTRAVATGNWGCGAFGGDPQLKSMLQWIAASSCDCPALIYYTFNDRNVLGLQQTVDHITERKWDTKQLFQKVETFCEMAQLNNKLSFFEFLLSSD